MTRLLFLVACLLSTCSVQAELKLPNIFGDHMVVQQNAPIRIWGTTQPGQMVTAELAGVTASATAGDEGHFALVLPALAADGKSHTLTIQADETKTFEDVLIGEVWICSGQSNMQWSVNASNDADLERLTANHPQLRMINFPQVGSQDPIWTHDRQWQVCTPETVGGFSAVGYFFGRQLLQTLNVPVGMINNAWGGSACEAWVKRDLLANSPEYQPLMERWSQNETTYEQLSQSSDLNENQKKQLENLKRLMTGNARPGNIYNGVLKSHLGYTIKGAIWYQGESNASRAYQYRELFPLMISSWRDEWKQGDFPFYWVQLADFRNEKAEPADSDWAELREAQTMTMSRLPKTGEAVIIDIGEGKDIHPKNKVDVGRRLARWALANDYGINVAFRSPQFRDMQQDGQKLVLSFDHVDGNGWRPFDVPHPVGFSVAGSDRRFVWADAAILPDGRIEVSSKDVAEPVAVRYGWADNPVCNLYDNAGLPLTPFRSDDWPGVTADNH